MFMLLDTQYVNQLYVKTDSQNGGNILDITSKFNIRRISRHRYTILIVWYNNIQFFHVYKL